MPPVIDNERCIPCGICIDVCPEDVFFGCTKKEVPRPTYPRECWHCAACIIDCPRQAIKLYIPLSMRVYTMPKEVIPYTKVDNSIL